MAESARQRQEFIEFRAVWEGTINRGDLTAHFGISIPQASNDLKEFLRKEPGTLVYDTRAKRYRAPPDLEPRSFPFDAARFFQELEKLSRNEASWLGSQLPIAEAPILGRHVLPQTVQAVAHAIRERQRISVIYQTMRHPEPMSFIIEPHAFASDGFRWHARAFVVNEAIFRDFVLSRMESPSVIGAAQSEPKDDDLWNRDIEVMLCPNRNLQPAPKRVIEAEYGMVAGKVSVTVKIALLAYFLTENRLDFDPDEKAEKGVHRLEVVNVEDVEGALIESGFLVKRLGRGVHASPQF